MEFRKIKSLNNLYEVNEDGTIFRNVQTQKPLKIKLDMHHSKTGYYTTFVHFGGRTENKKIVRVPIHKVVAECWLGDKPEGYEIDHIDRNSRNNNYKNLRYVTKSEQMKNRDYSNISKTGSKNLEKARKERSIQIKVIELDKVFESMAECARFLAANLGKPFEHIRHKLKSRYKEIYNYHVIYLN